jgi:hypothetical protein
MDASLLITDELHHRIAHKADYQREKTGHPGPRATDGLKPQSEIKLGKAGGKSGEGPATKESPAEAGL